jgi:endo-1,4-beta-D-glucanase Y
MRERHYESIVSVLIPLLVWACDGQESSRSCQSGGLGSASNSNLCASSGGFPNLATTGGDATSGGDTTSGGTLGTGTNDTSTTGAATGGAVATGSSASTGSTLGTGGDSGSVGGAATTGGAATIGGGATTGGTLGTRTDSTSSSGAATGGAATTGGSAATGGALSTGGDSGSRYLFPQDQRSPRCVYPTSAKSEDAKAAYLQWKTDLVVSEGAGGYQRVRRPENESNSTNNTVSEGIGYGMILAVIMDDQSLFDNLWNYSQIHTNANGLMIWLIDAEGSPGIEDATVSPPRVASGSATDADEDIAWALTLAAQKWNGKGSLTTTYKSLALSQISRIWTYEVDHSGINMINAGDSWGKTFAWNPSYFAPNEYRAFAKLDTTHSSGWNSVVDKGYQVLASTQNSTSGLFPAWTNSSGVPTPAFSGAATNYQYDAARVPFRIGLDYCDHGDTRAKDILVKTSAFFAGVGAASIVDGYSLSGTPTPENTSPTGVQSALFVGAAGVGAMSQSTYSSFVDDVYARLVTQPSQLMLPKSYYFNLSWKVFSLLMLSGNLFDYTLYP